jgi:hypothetical protein
MIGLWSVDLGLKTCVCRSSTVCKVATTKRISRLRAHAAERAGHHGPSGRLLLERGTVVLLDVVVIEADFLKVSVKVVKNTTIVELEG